ncbi:MAG: COP23 domain-containing protein [Cyanobacteria bacterium J06597_16]
MYQPFLKVCLSSIFSAPLLLISIATLQAQAQPVQPPQQSKQGTSKAPTLESLLSDLTNAELTEELVLPSASQSNFAPARGSTLNEFITDDIEISFFCGSNGEVPKTVVNNPLGEFTLIEWTKEFYPETNETPLDRCYSVASIFQDYYQQGLFSQIIAGEIEGAPAICISDLSGSSCGRVILLLESDENADNVADALHKSLLLLALEPRQSVDPSAINSIVSFLQLQQIPSRSGITGIIAVPAVRNNDDITDSESELNLTNSRIPRNIFENHISIQQSREDPRMNQEEEQRTNTILSNDEHEAYFETLFGTRMNNPEISDVVIPTSTLGSGSERVREDSQDTREDTVVSRNASVDNEIRLYNERLTSYLRIVNNSEGFSAVASPEEETSRQNDSMDRSTGGGGGSFFDLMMRRNPNISAPTGTTGSSGKR